ncbi:hypothetical protein [Maridesulfovibrio bastinii]|uniref:hypothetical protein n=1 Tax=Maridesulfovibrio bastinii TaxID=47157 RepID=UPI0004130060|nr:hypothetical protein [Maridesulfovibrio bastinii]
MKYFVITLLLILGGCATWHNPSLKPNEDRRAVYKKDRSSCLERSKKAAHSEPGNDYRQLKNYDALHREYKKENEIYNRCMRAKGWVKD